MPFSECMECAKVLERKGNKGFKLKDYCCPFCGNSIKNAKRPKYWADGLAVLKEDYKVMLDAPDLLEYPRVKILTGYFRPSYNQQLINEIFALCL